ncbi:hypothetical protein QWY93_00645 [Echinicola jeungdonensis]|uniref:Uncharacterized protein n=1 Tax=Echinicola jeungdonensis TaxID=709343 RepID=A0ABV5J2F1_9BACT|nr:hypothetical protein [Echinicola jeungdonensis]MDN3667849.1 hypothetical protein [Echinicola jeungdonensis]
MYEDISLDLLKDKRLFQEIHQTKNFFIQLFSELANALPEEKLLKVHEKSKGKKISKGNELEHCPYQVLDLVRDFDKKQGFNIRLLNWWGHGIFMLLYYGVENIPDKPKYTSLVERGYEVTQTGSPWEYKQIINDHRREALPSMDRLNAHVNQYHHVQLIKPLPYHNNYQELRQMLFEELNQVINFHLL